MSSCSRFNVAGSARGSRPPESSAFSAVITRSARIQMAGEEFDLIADQRLERLAEVEREVPGVVVLDLAAGCGACIAFGFRGRSHGVGITDAEQDWVSDLLGYSSGPVGHDRRDNPGGDLVAKRRVGRQQRLVSRQGI